MRILLVRLREIGDVVFTTPAVSALRARFPDAHLSYLVEPPAAPIVAAHPSLDDVILAPARTPAHRWQRLRAEFALIRTLRQHRFDLAIDFHGGPRASLITWLTGAPDRVGYDVAGRSWMYTRVVHRPRTLRARHSVENQWDLLSALGIDPPDRVRFPVTMAVDVTATAEVERRLQDAGVPPDARLIVIHVSAGNPFRRWPTLSFAAVTATLARDSSRHRVVVTSGPSERHASEHVVDAARATLGDALAHRVLKCGEFSLTELRALVERAALYIGGDSGPMHIASTSRVPMVSLYGPTLPARSTPWRNPTWPAEAVEVTALPCRPCDQRVCVPGDFRCLTGITPEVVVDASRRVLAAGAKVTEDAGTISNAHGQG